MAFNYFCKLFVDSAVSRQELISLIADSTGGHIDGRTIEAPWGEIDVVANEDHDESRKEELGGFVFFSHYLDIDASRGPSVEQYISSIRELMDALQRSGMTVVASCDFEADLVSTRPSDGSM